MTVHVEAIHTSTGHSFSKTGAQIIEAVAGLGLVGDAHFGARVQHRSRVAADPDQPNLRQVHLMHAELFDELAALGHHVAPGDLGENLTTRGIDLLELGAGTILRIGDEVILAVTGLRNPCGQIEAFQPGLLQHLRRRDPVLGIVRRAGVMATVVRGGTIAVGASIDWVQPPGDRIPLEPV